MATPSRVEGPRTGAHAEAEGGGDGLRVRRTPEAAGSRWQWARPAPVWPHLPLELNTAPGSPLRHQGPQVNWWERPSHQRAVSHGFAESDPLCGLRTHSSPSCQPDLPTLRCGQRNTTKSRPPVAGGPAERFATFALALTHDVRTRAQTRARTDTRSHTRTLLPLNRWRFSTKHHGTVPPPDAQAAHGPGPPHAPDGPPPGPRTGLLTAGACMCTTRHEHSTLATERGPQRPTCGGPGSAAPRSLTWRGPLHAAFSTTLTFLGVGWFLLLFLGEKSVFSSSATDTTEEELDAGGREDVGGPGHGQARGPLPSQDAGL